MSGAGAVGGSAGAGGSGGGNSGSGGSGGGSVGRDSGTATMRDAPAVADSGSPPAVVIGPTAEPPRAFQFPGVVAYWGQNAVGGSITDVTRQEKALADICRENPHYEAVIIGFIIEFFSLDNVDRTPRTNFSRHCNSMNAYDPDHRRLYRCDEIARGINECQRLNKKVLLSLGGATAGPSGYGFTSDDQARMFAQTTWDLFLGGQHNFRPFTTAILDGIDLDIESGAAAGYAAYVRRLRELMGSDPRRRRYYVTAAPQCPFPDALLGPRPGSALGDVPQLFDFINVQFYNNFCGGQNPDFFVSTFNSWSRVGPKVMVGLPAAVGAGNPFVSRAQLPGLLNMVKGNSAFGGVMLWDASYDQNSAQGGQTYGAFVKTQLP